jgi:hypothetical protein
VKDSDAMLLGGGILVLLLLHKKATQQTLQTPLKITTTTPTNITTTTATYDPSGQAEGIPTEDSTTKDVSTAASKILSSIGLSGTALKIATITSPADTAFVLNTGGPNLQNTNDPTKRTNPSYLPPVSFAANPDSPLDLLNIFGGPSGGTPESPLHHI